MLDRPADTPDYHFGRLVLTPGDRLLCLAPHPDDEVIGCGGLLALAHGQGLEAHCAIVTAGQEAVSAEGAASDVRLAESAAAAQVLGLPPPTCWHFSDRQLRCAPPLIARIAAALRQHRPRWLLLPALTEPHPDHQALALAGLAAAREVNGDTDLLFYEAGAPTQPNTLVDITPVAERKWAALEAFASQEERHPYRRHAQTMAALRAFGAGEGVQAAEAFWRLPASALHQPDAIAAMAFWPLQRQALGLAADSDQLPLVSVIVRSMNRPSLPQAIASLAAQSYPNIEVVVVNASGAPHPLPAYPPQRLTVRVVVHADLPDHNADGAAPQTLPCLGRSAAANRGLEACAGRYALFLDDDDHVSPHHLERLVDALQADARAVAAYSGVRVEGAGGQWVRDYDLPWEPRRLQGVNHLPIHAVLFRTGPVRAASARFDVSLPVLEDWDFWCQLSRLGHFVHVPGISATYRQGLGNSHLGDPEHDNHWAKWHQRILEQHGQRWGWSGQSAALAWHAIALDRAELAHGEAQRHLAQAQAALAQAHTTQQQLQAQHLQQTAEFEHARAQAQQWQAEFEHARAQAQQWQAEFEQARAQAQQWQSECEQARAHLLQLQADWGQSQAEVAHWHAAYQQSQAHGLQLQATLQQTQIDLARRTAEHDLAQRSLQMLQQSRPVRWARALRGLLGRRT